MNREELAAYLTDTYGTTGEHLFARYPSFQVFRHHGNKKWFAVIMDIPRKNLGLPGEGEISVVNLKCGLGWSWYRSYSKWKLLHKCFHRNSKCICNCMY